MKLNKIISKALIFNLIILSVSNLSYATTDIPDRYQTLEGEYITINNSTEGNLEEIEVFGNTVQDPNNLEDIQSVGELYVDENGNPILNSQGRKQYKIDIISVGNNLVNIKKKSDYPLNKSTGELNLSIVGGNYATTDYIYIVPGETYTKNSSDGSEICYYDTNKRFLFSETYTTGNMIIPTNKDIRYIRFTFNKSKDVFFGKGSSLKYEEYKENKTTILLPAQLQKVGNIADRLYWDAYENRYLIEKNIDIIKLDGTENWVLDNESEEFIRLRIKNVNQKNNSQLISTKFETLVQSWKENCLSTYKNVLYIQLLKQDLITGDINGVKDYLNNNISDVYYQLDTPEIIKTNITSRLAVPTYNEKTHIYVDSENSINPTLKVITDKLPQIAKDAVLEAENNSTSDNISLARMYINMLPESLYKDQLHEQLNQIFSSDMVLDKKFATSNADIYIKSKNTLSMSLNTNCVIFEDYSGTEDMEKLNAVELTINSSLPYKINAYLESEIQNADKSNTIEKSILNIKANNDTTYKTFVDTANPVILLDDQSAGQTISHGIDLKLSSNQAHKADVYKTVIKFEAEQK